MRTAQTDSLSSLHKTPFFFFFWCLFLLAGAHSERDAARKRGSPIPVQDGRGSPVLENLHRSQMPLKRGHLPQHRPPHSWYLTILVPVPPPLFIELYPTHTPPLPSRAAHWAFHGPAYSSSSALASPLSRGPGDREPQQPLDATVAQRLLAA